MDNFSSDENEQARPSGPSPIKRNKCGKIISTGERQRIVYSYKTILLLDPNKSVRQIRKIISDQIGVEERTIQKIITEYNNTKSVAARIPKRSRQSYIDRFGKFERNAVRSHVHQIWFRREIPTMDKIHQIVSSDKSWQ
ncbi:Winged helix-turn-helix DNA-binding domain, partial [Cinara cedri]